MSTSGHTIEVTSLSPKVTEKDVYDFFAFSGAIERVEMVRFVLIFLNYWICAVFNIQYFTGLHLLNLVNLFRFGWFMLIVVQWLFGFVLLIVGFHHNSLEMNV